MAAVVLGEGRSCGENFVECARTEGLEAAGLWSNRSLELPGGWRLESREALGQLCGLLGGVWRCLAGRARCGGSSTDGDAEALRRAERAWRGLCSLHLRAVSRSRHCLARKLRECGVGPGPAAAAVDWAACRRPCAGPPPVRLSVADDAAKGSPSALNFVFALLILIFA